MRSSAIADIVAQGSPQSVKPLIEALTDLDSMIRREAAKALQDMDATSATEPLLRALQTESNDLTLWAMLEAISELGTLSVLPTLESLLNVDSMLTRIEVKKSISRIQDRYTSEAAVTSPETSTPAPSQERLEDEAADERSSISIELISTNPPVNPTEPTLAELDEITDTADRAQPLDKSAEIIDETGPTAAAEISASLPNTLDEETGTDPENVGEATDGTQFANESVETTDETEGKESVSPNPESPQREDDTDIKDLSDTIARSPRLAGSSVNLPVLAPNAATVPYHPKGTTLEPTRANFFLTLLYPNRYFSKQWVSRTRAYLILWAVLIAGVIGFTQHQKHFRTASASLPRIGLSADALPELAKRSLS